MSALDDLVGQVYMDRDSRSFQREVKVVAVVESNGSRSSIVVETVAHPANPAAVGRLTNMRLNTLRTRYRRVR